MSKVQSVLFTLLGLGRAGQILYVTLFVLAVPLLTAYTVWLPAFRFSEADEHLFRAARHGDRGGIERALGEGARVTAVSPVDGKTALFRAAVFGHADAVRLLLERGVDQQARGNDGRTVAEVVTAARGAERDPAVATALAAVAATLAEPGSGR